MGEKHDEGLIVLNSEDLGQMITSMMQPVLSAIGTMLKNNTEAIDRIAATQTVMSDRMEALERQIRLNTPINSKQERYMTTAIHSKARQVLDKKGLADDKKAIKSVSAAIRKSVLLRYGIGSLRDIPRHEYTVAMSQISMWSDALVIRDVMKEARERAAGQDLAGLS